MLQHHLICALQKKKVKILLMLHREVYANMQDNTISIKIYRWWRKSNKIEHGNMDEKLIKTF